MFAALRSRVAAPLRAEAEQGDPACRELADIAASSGADLVRGLSSAEALRRLELHGPNTLESAPSPVAWLRALSQFQDPLIYLLLAAIGISLVAWLMEGRSGWPIDAVVISLVVMVNAVLGYVQQAKARNAVDALAKITRAACSVMRDGSVQQLPVAQWSTTAASYAMPSCTACACLLIGVTRRRIPMPGAFVDDSARTSGDGNAASTTGKTRGFFVGSLPWTVGASRVGIAGGHTSDALDADARHSSMSGNTYHAALYGMGKAGAIDLRLGAALSLHRLRTHRVVRYPGFSDTGDADRKARTVQIFGEAAHRLDFGRLTVEPFVGLAYVNVTTDGFAEGGGPAALRGTKGEQGVTYATLGVSTIQKISALGGDASARFKLGWRHAEGALAATAQHSIGQSTSFVVSGVPLARNSVVLDEGLEFRFLQGVTAAISYSGQFAKGRQNNGLRADLTWRF